MARHRVAHASSKSFGRDAQMMSRGHLFRRRAVAAKVPRFRDLLGSRLRYEFT